jgi:tetratricopeptide (TPR) repeat protein
MSKVKKKNLGKKSAPKTPKAEDGFSFVKNIEWKHSPLAIISLLVAAFVWSETYKPEILNPWQEGLVLLDSAKVTEDSVLKANILEQAGASFREDVSEFPYHARVWFLKGYYHTMVNEWDSVIACQKNALRLGAGGTVNLVEHDAANMMNSALLQKVNALNMDTTAIFSLLDSCEVKEFDNYRIHWLRGAIYNQSGTFDLAEKCLSRAHALNSRDFDILYHYSYALARRGKVEQAKQFLQTALSISPDNVAAKNLLKELNQ